MLPQTGGNRYKTVATLSTSTSGFVATTDGKTTGVDLRDFQKDRAVLVPSAHKDATALYDAHFRGFQLNPETVCTSVPPPRPERRVGVATSFKGGKMYGAVALTAADFAGAALPDGLSTVVYNTALGDIVVVGTPSAPHGTLEDHHKTPIRGDFARVKAERRRMRHRNGMVDLQPRLARFHIGDLVQ